MELKIKLLKWSAGLPVAILNKRKADQIGIRTNDRISIKTISTRPKEISTLADTIRGLVKRDEIAVSLELKKRLGLKVGQKVDVNLATPPKSLIYIKKKLNKKRLSKKEIEAIMRDVVNNSLSEPEISLYISAVHKHGMNMKETIYSIKAILKSGCTLKLRDRFVVDKHSIGGIPGNRTTPIMVPICAAAGLTFPKNSSRAITSAAGTADVIETIADVGFSIKQLKRILKKTKGCMVWGGALGMVPADSKLIKIEKQLNIDPQAQLLASIVSKKLAVNSKYIIIDIPYGKNAKVNKSEALELKKKFEYLGKYFHKKLRCVLTKGSQPIGCGIGPMLEIKDIIAILDPNQEGPSDLRDKALFLSGELLEMTGKAKKGKGIEMAEEILSSGKAFKKFKQIIKAQNGNIRRIKEAKFKHDILSKKSGKIVGIHNKKINSLAKVTGCPIDKSAGILLCAKVGDRIEKGKKILTLYAESKPRLNQAIKFYNNQKPVKIK
jgi:AMP phosphorylase